MSWLTNWNRRKQITVTGSTSGALSDYQMKLTINQASGTDSAGVVNLGGNVLTTFNDLRFTKSYDNTLLPYWIESITGTTPNQVATVWIKLAPSPDTIPMGLGTYSFYIYYNNISATTLTSNGTSTFQLFDDFSGASLDASKWVAYVGGNYYSGSSSSVGSGKMNLHIAGACYACYGEAGFYSVNSFTLSNPITIKYDASVVTKSVISGQDFGCAWPGAFTISTAQGYQAWQNQGANSFFSFYYTCSAITVRSYDGTTLHTLYTGAYNNVQTTVVINIDSTNVTLSFNGTPIYNGPHYLNASLPRYITYDHYADQPSWVMQSFDNISVRKYTSPEPTFSIAGTEELGVTAYSMSLTPNETPCRTGICTVRADVVWQNLGNSSVTFRPKILIDGITYVQTALDTTIAGAYPATSSTIQITTPTLSAGIHSICPDPN